MKVSKLSVAVVIVFISFCTNAYSANECAESKSASNVINLIKVFEVDLSDYGIANLEEAEQDIQDGQFCIDAQDQGIERMLKALKSLKFCNNLIMMGLNLFPGEAMGIKAKNPQDQAALEQAIYDYSLLYQSSEEKSGIGCDLKTLKFPAIGK